MAATEHEQRLTLCNRKLLEDLATLHLFIGRLIDPEDLGHAVSAEVRAEAKAVLTTRRGAHG